MCFPLNDAGCHVFVTLFGDYVYPFIQSAAQCEPPHTTRIFACS